MDTKFIDDLTRQLGDSLPSGLGGIKGDLEKNIRASLQAQLGKMNLVTRDEFDIQAAVLGRTREKVDSLERRVAMLEKMVLDTSE